MSDIDPTFATSLGNFALRGQAAPAPRNAYVKLCTDAAGTEVAYAGYTRPAAAYGAGVNGLFNPGASVEFPVPAATVGTDVTHFQLMDAAAGGNATSKVKALTNARTLLGGYTPRFAATELAVQF